MKDKLGYLTIHSYAEFIIYPYSSSRDAEANNKEELHSLAIQMSQNIENVHGKNYRFGEGNGLMNR